MPDDKNTIDAGRRRPSGPSKPTGRAETPFRRREGGEGGGLPPTSSGGGSQRPGLPGGLPRNMSLGGLLILIVLFFIMRQFMGGSDSGSSPPDTSFVPTEEIAQATSLPLEQPTAGLTQPRPTRTPSTASSGDTWTVMLYQDADDNILEKDIYVDLNEAERVGSSANVQIVAQIDRYKGGYQGDGDWVSARRYFVTQDDDLQRVRSEELEDLGEVNMADGKTLVDFVTWAMQAYPADKYAMILSDHGMGWPGGWSDPTGRGGQRDMPLAANLGDMLYLNELDQAWGVARTVVVIGHQRERAHRSREHDRSRCLSSPARCQPPPPD